MRRSSNWATKKYPPISLYFDDLEKVFNSISKSGQDVTITSGDFIFDSLDEFYEQNKNKKIRSFSISSDGFNFDLSKFGGFSIMYKYSQDINLRSYYEINQILLKNKNIFGFLFKPWVGPIAVACTFIIPSFKFEYNVDLYLSAFLLLIIILSGFGSVMWQGQIIVACKSDRTGWIERNRDVFVAIISSIIGGLFVLFVDRYFSK